MNEQNPVSPETTIAELQSRVSELQDLLEVASRGVQSWANRFKTMKSQVQAWADEELLDNDEDPISVWLLEEFDVELTEEIYVTVMATYSGTITVKKGTDVSEIEVITDLPWNLSFEGNLDSNVSYDDIDISLN